MFAPKVMTTNGATLVVFRDGEIWNCYPYSEENVEKLKEEIKADLQDCADMRKVVFTDDDFKYSNVLFRAYLKGHEYDRAGEYYRIQRY